MYRYTVQLQWQDSHVRDVVVAAKNVQQAIATAVELYEGLTQEQPSVTTVRRIREDNLSNIISSGLYAS